MELRKDLAIMCLSSFPAHLLTGKIRLKKGLKKKNNIAYLSDITSGKIGEEQAF